MDIIELMVFYVIRYLPKKRVFAPLPILKKPLLNFLSLTLINSFQKGDSVGLACTSDNKSYETDSESGFLRGGMIAWIRRLSLCIFLLYYCVKNSFLREH
jgi:hypothetical protein